VRATAGAVLCRFYGQSEKADGLLGTAREYLREEAEKLDDGGGEMEIRIGL